MYNTKLLCRLYVIFIITVLSSCNEERIELLDGDKYKPEEISLNTNLRKITADITIFPSGDLSGVSDANNIQTALNGIQPGGTILLEEGTFYTNRTIVALGGFDGIILMG